MACKGLGMEPLAGLHAYSTRGCYPYGPFIEACQEVSSVGLLAGALLIPLCVLYVGCDAGALLIPLCVLFVGCDAGALLIPLCVLYVGCDVGA